MLLRPPSTTPTDSLVPYTTLVRSIHITQGDRPRTVYPPLRLLDHTDWYVGEDRARIVRRVRRSDRGYRAPPNLLLNERSEEHTSELQSLMRISYAVFCLKTTKRNNYKVTSTYTTYYLI